MPQTSTLAAEPGLTLTAQTGTKGAAAQHRAVSSWEFLPGWIVHTPLVLQWFALGLRHGSFATPLLANPTISTGGMCNESKAAIFTQLAPSAEPWIAPWALFPAGPDALAAADAAIARLGLTYPLVLKPDIGCTGVGVKLVSSRAALIDALAAFAPATPLMVQYFIPYEGEAGVFYSRLPGAAQGEIVSTTLKDSPFVTGDGTRTLHALVMAHPRAGQLPHLYLPRLADRLDTIPAAGERVRLVFTGNHCRGSVFTDATARATPALRDRIEAILGTIGEFHHGRVDLRFSDLDALLRGEGFSIIEINGVGSEATHVWDSRTRLRDIFLTQARILARAFTIGAANRRRGWRSPGIIDLFVQWRRHERLARTYPIGD